MLQLIKIIFISVPTAGQATPDGCFLALRDILPDQCLFHLPPLHRTELPTCPRPQLMVVLIKEAVRGGPSAGLLGN